MFLPPQTLTICRLKKKRTLKGLSTSFIESLKENAERLKIEAPYALTLIILCYIPFMQNAENRELREKLIKARFSQCYGEDKNNNENLILEIVATRAKRAKLLGFENHADYVLKNRMALNETTVMNFLQELTEKSLPAAKRETEELINFARENGFEGEFL